MGWRYDYLKKAILLTIFCSSVWFVWLMLAIFPSAILNFGQPYLYISPKLKIIPGILKSARLKIYFDLI
jgi:hypothetical protein